MQSSHVFTIGPDHPSLPGHFPGQPLVPGVVLVEAAIAPLLAARGGRVASIAEAKFLAPVRFGEPVAVTFADAATDRVTVTATAGGTTVLRCRLHLDTPA